MQPARETIVAYLKQYTKKAHFGTPALLQMKQKQYGFKLNTFYLVVGFQKQTGQIQLKVDGVSSDSGGMTFSNEDVRFLKRGDSVEVL